VITVRRNYPTVGLPLDLRHAIEGVIEIPPRTVVGDVPVACGPRKRGLADPVQLVDLRPRRTLVLDDPVSHI